MSPAPAPVLAIVLDSAEESILKRMAAAGDLPHIAGLLERASVGEIESRPAGLPETIFTALFTGCHPQTARYWGQVDYGTDYTIRGLQACELDRCPPFFRFARGKRIVVVDPPQTRADPQAGGLQVMSWGAHSPQIGSHSFPETLLDEVTQAHGRHPAFEQDWMGVTETRKRTAWLLPRLLEGIRRRTAMAKDLLARGPFDLAVVVYGEAHAAEHCFWHLEDPAHPAHGQFRDMAVRPISDVFRALDAAVGELVAAAPGAAVMLIATHGACANNADLNSNAFLPELLYRHAFPGRQLIGADAGGPLPAMDAHRSGGWIAAVWASQREPNPVVRAVRNLRSVKLSYWTERLLGSASPLKHPANCFERLPPGWYEPFWRQMPAFALPSFSDGWIRLNLAGRERSGIVAGADYGRVCDEIEAAVRAMRNARTGQPVVADVERCRPGPTPDAPDDVPGDLAVTWRQDTPADVVDTPYGRIGPLPFNRSGAHTNRGLVALARPGAGAGRLPKAEIVDIAPTLLDLVGAPKPNHMDGKSLLPTLQWQTVA